MLTICGLLGVGVCVIVGVVVFQKRQEQNRKRFYWSESSNDRSPDASSGAARWRRRQPTRSAKRKFILWKKFNWLPGMWTKWCVGCCSGLEKRASDLRRRCCCSFWKTCQSSQAYATRFVTNVFHLKRSALFFVEPPGFLYLGRKGGLHEGDVPLHHFFSMELWNLLFIFWSRCFDFRPKPRFMVFLPDLSYVDLLPLLDCRFVFSSLLCVRLQLLGAVVLWTKTKKLLNCTIPPTFQTLRSRAVRRAWSPPPIFGLQLL